MPNTFFAKQGGFARIDALRYVAGGLGDPIWGALGVVAAVALAGLWLFQHEQREALEVTTWIRAEGYDSGDRQLAEWLGEQSRSGDTVALMDIGIVGYECPELRILDITGLTDRRIARSPGRFLEKRYDPGYVLEQRPRFIVLVAYVPRTTDEPDPESARFTLATPIERAIVADARFRDAYQVSNPTLERSERWFERIAARLGAEAAFWHVAARHHYLLLAFSRRE